MNKSKFLALSLVAMLFSIGTAFAYDQPSLVSYEEKRNAGGRQSDPVRVLKLVRNASRDAVASGWISTTGFASGDAVRYDLISDDGVTVAYSAANSGDSAFAGICVTLIPSAESASTSALDDIGKRNWGWILVHGPVIANISVGGTNAHSAGDPFIMSNDFGKVTTFGNTTGSAVGSTLKQGRGGFFLDAVTAANSSEEVFVQAE